MVVVSTTSVPFPATIALSTIRFGIVNCAPVAITLELVRCREKCTVTLVELLAAALTTVGAGQPVMLVTSLLTHAEGWVVLATRQTGVLLSVSVQPASRSRA